MEMTKEDLERSRKLAEDLYVCIPPHEDAQTALAALCLLYAGMCASFNVDQHTAIYNFITFFKKSEQILHEHNK